MHIPIGSRNFDWSVNTLPQLTSIVLPEIPYDLQIILYMNINIRE